MSIVACGCGPKIYNDGTYRGVSTADDHGFVIAEVTVKGDKIQDVKLTEFDGLALEKDMGTYEWEPAREASREMPGRFLGRQDAKVDTFTGATTSSTKQIVAVSFALEKSKKKPETVTEFFDGTFMGRSKGGETGYGIAFVTIKKDVITGVRLLEVTEEGKLLDFATYSYTPLLQAKEKIEKAMVEKNGPEVDTFSGATTSSEKWIAAANEALKVAKRK